MKNIASVSSKLFLTAAIFFSILFVTSQASADIWGNLADRAKRVGRTIDPTNPGSATSPILKYDIVIRNPSGSGVHYTFDGRPDLIGAEKTTTWNVKNTSSTIVVSFDNGNNQTVTYDLGEGRYVFQWNNGVLDLFKD